MRTKGVIFIISVFILMFFVSTISSINKIGNRKREMRPDDKHMYYILFPIDTNTTLQRAILVSAEELFDNKPFEYYDGEDTYQIEKEKMTLRPPEDESLSKTYIARLNEEIKKWGKNTDWLYVTFNMHSETGQVNFRLRPKTGISHGYIYSIDEALTPKDCFMLF